MVIIVGKVQAKKVSRWLQGGALPIAGLTLMSIACLSPSFCRC